MAFPADAALWWNVMPLSMDASMFCAIGPPPGLSLSSGTSEEERSAPIGSTEQPNVPAPVLVKSKFIHVDDEERAKSSCRSKRDKHSGKPSVSWRTGHEGFNLARGATSPMHNTGASYVPFEQRTRDTSWESPAEPWPSYPELLGPVFGASSSAQDDSAAGAVVVQPWGDDPWDRTSAPWPASSEPFGQMPGASSAAHDTTAPCSFASWSLFGESWDRASTPWLVDHEPLDPVTDTSGLDHHMAALCTRSQPSRASVVNEAAASDDQDHSPDGKAEWSAGSAHHDAGNCRPCIFFAGTGCTKGVACAFCHMPHRRKARIRPCKARRDQCKQIAAMLGGDDIGNQQGVEEALRRRCLEGGGNVIDSSYLLRVVRSRARLQSALLEQPEASVATPFRMTGRSKS